MKALLKKFIPPVLVSVYHRLKSLIVPQKAAMVKQVFEGNYATWDDALKETSGYDADNILEKVKDATLKVIKGEAAFERDSVLFYKNEYNWALLAVLLRIATVNNNSLKVLDFGGALGSIYFQNRDFLSGLNKLEWDVVEQEKFVNCGKTFIENGELKFYKSIADVFSIKRPDVILLANVIQYLPNPNSFIEEIISHECDYIVLDSTAFIEDEEARLTIQSVPETIYKASYPAWFFNQTAFLNNFEHAYDLLFDFESEVTRPMLVDNKKVFWKGLVFKHKAK
jgi:putative methyltransferase (TIGR04325 family)